MNRPYSSDEIRDTFLGFFTERQHARIESASIIPANDPTLLFVNAGMAPLKPYFLGEALPPAPDLCNVQPCVRTIDIGDVGDRHHLTFFEMLGSWSIGHYFKDRAVELAFELLTQGFGFAVDDLYMTVFAGDEELGIAADDVSAAAWERMGVPRDHIVYLGAEDNFWSAGDTGPCGPCTEVFYDTGAEHGTPYRPGGEFDSTRRYIEIWNAGVFMEYNRLPGGRLEPLRFSSVDTGSGLERMAMVLQGRESAYETDLFTPVVAAVQDSLAGTGRATDTSQRDIRIIADHVRASTFILSEGVAPSNEGRGYIPRRLLRKVIAVATQAGAADFDLAEVADAVIGRMGDHYPQLVTGRDHILDLLAREQRDFGRVVHRGLDRLAALATGPGAQISGDEAFRLVATHGMPADLIRDFAAERGGSIDERRFAELLAEHRELSRGAASGPAPRPGDVPDEAALADRDVIAALDLVPTRFVGHTELAAPARVIALAGPDGPADSLTSGQRGLAVFDQTPFYAEGGGQVGDTGLITGPGLTARVTDTWSADGRHVHDVEVTDGTVRTGDAVVLAVDAARRRAVMRNHSATHLLHAALRQVLGPHVRQAGSLVAPDRLRFDFLHPEALTEDQADEVERLVNAEVLENVTRTTAVRPYSDAIRDGAIAFFGDRYAALATRRGVEGGSSPLGPTEYGDDVRVVSFGDFSTELCGGTHVRNSAEVGLFRIVSEGSIGSGVRRIEAVTGDAAVQRTLERDRLLRELAARLRVPVDQLPVRVDALTTRAGRDRPARASRLDADQLTGGRAQAEDGEQHRREATHRLLDHYLHTAHQGAHLMQPQRGTLSLAPARPGVTPEPLADNERALAWFQAEHRVLLGAVAMAADSGFGACAWQLPWCMATFLDWQGHWHDWAATQRIALAAVTPADGAAASADDKAVQAVVGRAFAAACIRLADYDTARTHLTTCLRIYRELGDQGGQSRIHRDLGSLAEYQERYDEALGHAEQALRMSRAAGDRDGEAFALSNVSSYHMLLGQHQQALVVGREALELTQRLGARYGEAHTWATIGLSQRALGRFAEAADSQRHAHGLFAELGDRTFEATALDYLADAQEAGGQACAALATRRKALAILRGMQHPDAVELRAKLTARL